MDKAVEEVVDQCRLHGDFGHRHEAYGDKRRMTLREGPGRGARGDHNHNHPGKQVLTHFGGEDYVCNPEEHTAVAAHMGILKKRK